MTTHKRHNISPTQNSLSTFLIPSNKIHLYTFSFDALRTCISHLTQDLKPSEIRTANTYAFKELSENYIISRSILKRVLARYINAKDNASISPSQIEFKLGPYGKPYLKLTRKHLPSHPQASQLQFNPKLPYFYVTDIPRSVNSL